jgi:hypothetical protein
MNEDIQKSKAASNIVISVMGPHCGDSPEEIFQRKLEDIDNLGITFWSMKSHKAKPDLVQGMVRRNRGIETYVILIDPSTPNGSKDTKPGKDIEARQYSPDRFYWDSFNEKMNKVTVNPRGNAFAFKFD